MKSVISFCFLMICIQLFAQSDIPVISGIVIDTSGKGIAYASATLRTNGDSLVQGDLTDEQGCFTIKGVPRGKYIISISFVGYQTYSKEIEVSDNIKLPPIQLQEGLELNEIVVTAQKKLVSYKQGKINLTVENSKLANLPAAIDVLSFVPGIIVQGSDISVVGRNKTLILINGKEVKSTSQIESLQPEMIKNITLDRNPSAKYDASYNSVINITTKQNLGKDLSAQYIQGAGMNHHFTHSETLNLNHTNGKFTNFLSYKFKNSKNTESANTYQNILINNDLQANGYDATMTDNNDDHSLAFASNFKLNRKNTVDLQYFFNSSTQKADAIGVESMEGITNQIFNVNRYGNSTEQEHTINLSYTLTIDTIRSLQFFGDYSHLKNKSAERILSVEQALNNESRDTMKNYSAFDTYSLRAEYSTKLFSHYDWKLGTRYAVIKSNAQSQMNGNAIRFFIDSHSNLTEANFAAYTTLSRQFNSLYAELGLRVESTNSKYFENGAAIFEKPRKSTHFFPSVLLNYDFSEDLQLNFNYASKIQRPAFADIDPALSYLSSVLYSQGNPGLKPLIVHNIELDGVIKRNFNLSAAYKVQNNLPAYIIEQSDDNPNVLINRPININHSSMLDFTATYMVFKGSFTSNLIGNFAVPFIEYPYHGKIEKSNIPMFQFVTMSRYAFSPTVFAFCNFGYKSKYTSINTVIYPTYRLTAGVNWVLMNGKMILTLFGNDLLHKSEPAIASKYGMVDFGQSSTPDTRMVGISLKYNFNGFRNLFKKSDSNQQDLDRITK